MSLGYIECEKQKNCSKNERMEKSETFVIHILQGMDCMSICAFSLEAVKLLPLYTYILTFVDITEYLTVKYFSFRV